MYEDFEDDKKLQQLYNFVLVDSPIGPYFLRFLEEGWGEINQEEE